MFWKNNKKEKTVTPTLALTEDVKNEIYNEKIKEFLSFLKNTYDYDTVTYYNFEKPYDIKKYEIFENALNFSADNYFERHKLEYDSETWNNYCERLVGTFRSIKIVHLVRKYDTTRTNFYLFIYTVVDNDNLRICISEEYNNLSLFNIPEYNDSNGYGKMSRSFIHKFLEYNEIFTTSQLSYKNLCHVTEITCPISIHPIINFNHKMPNVNTVPDRMAQILIKYCPDQWGLYSIDMKLCYGKKLIKHSILEDRYINRSVNKFIFPLDQNENTLSELGLHAELTEEFMSQDFTSFMSINDMLKI